jgi:hypothetical protein
MSMTSPSIPVPARDAFYAAAARGLRLLDARERTPRRFGPEADTRWAAFCGGLTESDRLDLLLRDAAVAWGPAFSPAEAFGLFGLAPDEPFGPDWQTLPVRAARELFEVRPVPTAPAAVARLLKIEPAPVEVPPLTAATRLAVAGGAALLAVAEAFARQPGLSWSDQVLAVATSPAHRQLAGLLAVALDQGRTRLVRPTGDVRVTLKVAGFVQVDTAVISADAEAQCRDFATRAGGAS